MGAVSSQNESDVGVIRNRNWREEQEQMGAKSHAKSHAERNNLKAPVRIKQKNIFKGSEKLKKHFI